MSETNRLKWLRIALVAFGLIFLVGLFLLGLVWPSGWSWHTGYSDYYLMIVGVYATLGLFLIAAARDPLANRSLIQFTIWSSVVHGLIMTFSPSPPAATAISWATCPRCFWWPWCSAYSCRETGSGCRSRWLPSPGRSDHVPRPRAGACTWCGARGPFPARDHVFPRSLGGALQLAVPSCSLCDGKIRSLEHRRDAPRLVSKSRSGRRRASWAQKPENALTRRDPCLHP